MRKRKKSPVKVTTADGKVRFAKAGSFQKPKRRRAVLAVARKTPHWRALRLRALEREGFRCAVCRRGDRLLEVHHLTYERLGAELLEDVVALCQRCHATEHAWARRGKRTIDGSV